MTNVQMFNSQLKFSNEDGILTDIAFVFLHQLWLRTGGYTDITTDSALAEESELYYWNTPSLDIFEQVITTGSNITVYGNAIIIATSNITITLNPAPMDKERITIKRATTAGNVIVNSSTILIDGALTYLLITNYEAIQLIYSSANNEWLIV